MGLRDTVALGSLKWWSGAAFVAVAAVLLVYTSTVFVFALGAALAAVAIGVSYYALVRLDRAARGGI